MSELVVIGIAGKARSGKDSVSGTLTSRRGFHRVALADGVRAAFNDLSGPTGEFYKDLTPEHNYRRALQTLGTEGRERAGYHNLWVGLTLTKIAYASSLHPNRRGRFVIPDVRFPFEVALLRDGVERLGGTFSLWEVFRPGHFTIAESSHASEAGLGDIEPDVTIYNESSLDDLARITLGATDELLKAANAA
jgi:hypothetical protein